MSSHHITVKPILPKGLGQPLPSPNMSKPNASSLPSPLWPLASHKAQMVPSCRRSPGLNDLTTPDSSERLSTVWPCWAWRALLCPHGSEGPYPPTFPTPLTDQGLAGGASWEQEQRQELPRNTVTELWQRSYHHVSLFFPTVKWKALHPIREVCREQTVIYCDQRTPN